MVCVKLEGWCGEVVAAGFRGKRECEIVMVSKYSEKCGFVTLTENCGLQSGRQLWGHGEISRIPVPTNIR
jgi:hypothetical protein